MKPHERQGLIIVLFVVVVEKKNLIQKIFNGAMIKKMLRSRIFILLLIIEIEKFYNMIKITI